MTTIQNTNDLLAFLERQAEQRQDWFGWRQQKLTAITLVHEIAARHANTMSPHEIVDFVMSLNQLIYNKIIKPQNKT